MKSIIILKASLTFLFLAVILTSCFKANDDIDLDEQDITLTYYETGFDFQQYNTFAIRNKVGLVSDYLTAADSVEFYKPGGPSDQIRNYIRQKFESLGYQEVSTDGNYDFGVNVVATFIKNTYIVGNPGWWWGYPGYWWGYPGYWPPYYPGWYPPYWYSVYSYKTGTIMIEQLGGESVREYLLFLETHTQEEIEAMPPGEIPDIDYHWQAFVQGVLANSSDYNADRLERGVDEAFEQSPYLEKN